MKDRENRRFVVLEVGEIDLERLENEIMLLYGEAIAYAKEKYGNIRNNKNLHIVLDAEMREEQAKHNEKFRVVSELEEWFTEWTDGLTRQHFYSSEFRTQRESAGIKAGSPEISRLLPMLGYVQDRESTGKQLWFWKKVGT